MIFCYQSAIPDGVLVQMQQCIIRGIDQVAHVGGIFGVVEKADNRPLKFVLQALVGWAEHVSAA